MTRNDEPKPVLVWGLPLTPYTLDETVAAIDRTVASGPPGYMVTANLHYAMLSSNDPRLQEVNEKAAFVLADGMPLVWAARLQKTPLPQRVAGSDLIWRICELAAARRYPIFILGGGPGVAEVAARKMIERYPGLVISGYFCPPFRTMTEVENSALLDQLRASRSQILIVALSQPKGELWIVRNFEMINIPFAIQLGASIDFVAGTVRRAPRWMQRTGLEWAFRLSQEPRRLARRYWSNGIFLIRMLLGRTRPRRQ